MKQLFLIAVLACLTMNSYGNSGKPLEWNSRTGDIIDVTEQYAYINFDLKNLRLTIDDKELLFPRCMRTYFDSHEDQRVQFEISRPKSEFSWLAIGVYPKDKKHNIILHISPETLLPLGFYISVHERRNSWIRRELKISEYCLSDIEKNITSVFPPNLKRSR